jgi:hypothetical protein
MSYCRRFGNQEISHPVRNSQSEGPSKYQGRRKETVGQRNLNFIRPRDAREEGCLRSSLIIVLFLLSI